MTEGEFIGFIAEQFSLFYLRENGHNVSIIPSPNIDGVKSVDFILNVGRNFECAVEVKFFWGDVEHLHKKLQRASKQLRNYRLKILHLHVLPSMVKEIIKKLSKIDRRFGISKIYVFSCGELRQVIS